MTPLRGRRSPTTLNLWDTPVSPFQSLMRPKDSSVERHRDKCDLAVTLRRRRREQEIEVFAERLKPGHCKPRQSSQLKRKAKTECGLIGRDRRMSVLRRPLLDHEPNAVLHHERPAKVQEIQSAIGARSKFFREVVGYDREAYDCCGASAR